MTRPNKIMGALAVLFHAVSGNDMIRKFGYRECPKR
jgi:hypothetical protein